jgi:hypothetical protein
MSLDAWLTKRKSFWHKSTPGISFFAQGALPWQAAGRKHVYNLYQPK